MRLAEPSQGTGAMADAPEKKERHSVAGTRHHSMELGVAQCKWRTGGAQRGQRTFPAGRHKRGRKAKWEANRNGGGPQARQRDCGRMQDH
eukprot:1544994-Pyramimonas_sp.AAC.1